MSTPVAIGLGSNLDDRLEHLRYGAAGLRRLLDDAIFSSIYETMPREVEDQPRFLNACCTGRTRLTPRQLLAELQHLELLSGRRREGRRFGPRTLDLDLLLFGERSIDEDGLVVPHPRMRERGFVLIPLAELAPDTEVPASGGTHRTTVERLASEVGAKGVRRTSHEWEQGAE